MGRSGSGSSTITSGIAHASSAVICSGSSVSACGTCSQLTVSCGQLPTTPKVSKRGFEAACLRTLKRSSSRMEVYTRNGSTSRSSFFRDRTRARGLKSAVLRAYILRAAAVAGAIRNRDMQESALVDEQSLESVAHACTTSWFSHVVERACKQDRL